MKQQQDYPIKRERFEGQMDRLRFSPASRVPVVGAMTCWMALKAYYGGSCRALWELAKWDWMMYRGYIWSIITMWCSDKLGYTKVYTYPATSEMREMRVRHGIKCHASPNCEDIECINNSLPRWFKWLFRTYDPLDNMTEEKEK